MIETGLAQQEPGKLILAGCFVTDLVTVLFLGLLFAVSLAPCGQDRGRVARTKDEPCGPAGD